MNEERIEELAQTIEAAQHRDTDVEPYRNILYENIDGTGDMILTEHLPEAFNLAWFYAAPDRHMGEPCDTVGCIAGYCAGLFEGIRYSDVIRAPDDYVSFVRDTLGIPHEVSRVLCCPSFTGPSVVYKYITPQQAAQAVRNLLTLTDEELEYDPYDLATTSLMDTLWAHVPTSYIARKGRRHERRTYRRAGADDRGG